MGRDALERDGMRRDMEKDKWNGAQWMGRDTVEWGGMGHEAMERDRMGHGAVELATAEQYEARLEEVAFSYGEKQVLRNLSLAVRPGERIGIIGDSGCGKSTLLKLLAGLYEPDRGRVEVAGKRTAGDIRQQVALVMQQNALFPLSIRDNITCGHPVPEAALWEVCRGASLTDWIESLPQGLDTHVGQRGGQVSGGQAQRIQIARALCKDAPVILLDEPVSALDRDTGRSVLAALGRLTAGRTVIHVTHHPEALDGGYAIYRLEGGRLLHG